MTKTGGKNTLLLILISYIAFISLGLPDCLLGISWPFMSESFEVSLDSLGILLIAGGAGYLITSSSCSTIMKFMSLGVLLAASCALTGISLLIYSYTDIWYLIILASFFSGAGGGAIDSSLNAFASINFSPSVVNWLHAFYGVGATTGPVIMTYLFTHGGEWFEGYRIVGCVQISLALLFLFTGRYWKNPVVEDEVEKPSGVWETLKFPIAWVSILLFFLYTGLEIAIGQWLFSILTLSREMAPANAAIWPGAYWASITAGRILFGFVLTKITVSQVLRSAIITTVLGAFLIAANLNKVLNLTGVVIIGLSLAPIFPCLISQTPANVGKQHSANLVGFQISAAMLGGALLPSIAGWLSTSFDLEIIPKFYVLLAVLLLIFYAASRKLKLNPS